MAELGVGELAKRRDSAWTTTVLVGALDESVPADGTDDANEPEEQLSDLLQQAIYSGKLSDSDRDLLLDLAHAAEQADAPGRRIEVG